MTQYGENEMPDKYLCPRCVCAVPVFIRTVSDRFETRKEIHCLKCKYYRNSETYITDA